MKVLIILLLLTACGSGSSNSGGGQEMPIITGRLVETPQSVHRATYLITASELSSDFAGVSVSVYDNLRVLGSPVNGTVLEGVIYLDARNVDRIGDRELLSLLLHEFLHYLRGHKGQIQSQEDEANEFAKRWVNIILG